jgi:hypothetical protein
MACFASVGNNIENLVSRLCSPQNIEAHDLYSQPIAQDVLTVVKKESALILGDVKKAVEDIPTIVNDVWNEMKGWFDKVKESGLP